MARAGILSPSRDQRRHYRFGFQDLVLLRSAQGLLDASVPRRRVSRALRRLVDQLPEGRKPSEVRLTTDGQAILVQDGALVWHLEDGQMLLDFNRSQSAAVAPLLATSFTESEAEEWYQLGIEHEPFDPEEACRAYAEALARDPSHVGAHVNLGRLIQHERPEEAIRHYRAALESEPSNATAAFNLGTALEYEADVEEAIAAYRLALRLNPALADAHFNLSLLYQQTGHKLAALVHLKRYRELTDHEAS
jgi:tetratricopeptide (TPR) repeat protein